MSRQAWRVIGASSPGTSHQITNTPCQDFHTFQILTDGELIVAVADGAGSAERGAEGAEWLVNRVIASLQADLNEEDLTAEETWRTIMTQAFREARDTLADFAEAENTALQLFAATLICTIATEDWLVVGHIGSDALIVRDTEGLLFTAARPQRGEFVEETNFLTMHDFLHYVDIQTYHQQIQSLAVLTDGLTKLALNMPDHEPYFGFFDPLLSFVAEMEDMRKAQEELTDFLASESVCARTDDDKTLVLATRLGPS